MLALGAAESRIPFVSFSEAFARQGALRSGSSSVRSSTPTWSFREK